MNRIMERWNGNLAEALKLHDMSTTMMRALAVLSISSPVTINELSAYAVTKQSTMSRTLDILEAQGLVRRQRRSEDMRIRDVSITEEGRAAFERVWPMMHARFQALSTASRRTNTAHSLRRCSNPAATRKVAGVGSAGASTASAFEAFRRFGADVARGFTA